MKARLAADDSDGNGCNLKTFAKLSPVFAKTDFYIQIKALKAVSSIKRTAYLQLNQKSAKSPWHAKLKCKTIVDFSKTQRGERQKKKYKNRRNLYISQLLSWIGRAHESKRRTQKKQKKSYLNAYCISQLFIMRTNACCLSRYMSGADPNRFHCFTELVRFIYFRN